MAFNPDPVFKIAKISNCQNRRNWDAQILAITNFGNSGNLPLSLLVFRVLADHAHHAFAMHDLALVTDLFD